MKGREGRGRAVDVDLRSVLFSTGGAGGGGGQGTRSLPLDQNFFIFMQFSGKIGQIVV